MKRFNKDIGNFGEDLSVKYLVKKGYEILHRNFRCRLGEIDIISKSHNGYICFTEVKSRYNCSYGSPHESITRNKVKKIRAIAELYIMKNNLNNVDLRFDVIEIVFNNSDDNYIINFIENAF